MLVPNYKDVLHTFKTAGACYDSQTWIAEANPPIKDLRDAVRRCPSMPWLFWAVAEFEPVLGDTLYAPLVGMRARFEHRKDRMYAKYRRGESTYGEYKARATAAERGTMQRMKALTLRFIERKSTTEVYKKVTHVR